MPSNSEYTIGWIAAIETELVAASLFLDEAHGPPESQDANDSNVYKLGSMGRHKVVIACLPQSEYGLSSAAVVATNMLRSFPNIRIGLMVGIAGGAPRDGHDIRLGDVVVSARSGAKGAVFQYDYGKAIQNEPFTYTQLLNQPPAILRAAVTSLSAQHQQEGHDFESQIARILQKPRLKKYRRPPPASDKLCKPDVVHSSSCTKVCGGNPEHLVTREPRDEDEDDPIVHYGIIASANQLMKDAEARDRLAAEHDVLCFEMEAAGLMNNFPCLVIRGICDYSDSHKNKEWQGFAAMMAAAYAKALLGVIVPDRITAERTINEAIGSVERKVNMVEEKVTTLQSNAHIENIKRWLSPADPSTNANRAKGLRHPGTGTWLLENHKFKEWQDGPCRQLWLRALVGCGKTVLCAAVLEQLAQLDCLVLSFFFDFGDAAKQTRDCMLRALVFQLYLNQPESQSREYLDKLFQTICKGGDRQPSGDELWECLKSMLKTARKKVYIVLDALDESKTRRELTMWIKDVVSGPELHQLHLIFTSRPEPDFDCIPSLIGRDNCLELDKEAVNADIRAYVLSRLENDDEFVNKKLPEDLIEDISNRIGNGADGMFRWASCQLQTLSECASVFDIRSALRDLPRDLKETYTRMVENIPEPFEKAAIRLLTFLVHCERPLKLSEGKDVIATTETEPEGFDWDRRPFDEAVLRHCPGMITIILVQTYEGIIYELHLAHFSIKEFLLGRTNFEIPTACICIVKTCLLYLTFIPKYYDDIRLDFPLAQLAARLWTTHAYQAQASDEASKEITPDVVKLFQSYGTFQLWGQLYQPEYPKYPSLRPPSGSGLYYVCFMGLKEVAIHFLHNGADVNAQGARYGNALQAASCQGHADIVILLLENGADVNARGGRYGNALQAAICEYYTDIVTLLLENGADVNLQGCYYKSALQAAIYEGHTHIVRLLLKNGADVNAKGDGEFQSAYEIARNLYNKDIVQLLQHYRRKTQ
ncbi:uncharacterized protein PgNI_09641 [Pyricularia grisea]|uniref:Nephrocystin 3-like N-terminal domain-containing protein n=1 Tax=Pyricularia grisea TaxID=148305 RepID=A0A6P8AT42_PYRGI|nr:uncharacterized protein PgNI_09641 [Pyricularia grisea]TLD05262.1 hypothetical protein PgNI_09641 [Pyricularia grisea]